MASTAWLSMQMLMTTPTLFPHRWEAARLWHGCACKCSRRRPLSFPTGGMLLAYGMATHAGAHDDAHSLSPQVGGCSPMAWLRSPT
jgi:hypothetical protein